MKQTLTLLAATIMIQLAQNQPKLKKHIQVRLALNGGMFCKLFFWLLWVNVSSFFF